MNNRDYSSCRFRRNFMAHKIERWTSYCNYRENVVSDTILINWKQDIPQIVLFSNSENRMQSEKYIEEIFGLFEDLTDGEGAFEFKKFFVVEPCDYYPDELLKLANAHTNYSEKGEHYEED